MLLAELLRGEIAAAPTLALTLGILWRRYSSECAEYLDNKERSKKSAESSARVLIGHFGDGCLVDDLGKDGNAHSSARMIGGIVLENGDTTQKTRARSAELDVSLLHGVLLWAMTVRSSNGAYLLSRNELAGVKRIREKNRKQPAATWERTRQQSRRCRTCAPT